MDKREIRVKVKEIEQLFVVEGKELIETFKKREFPNRKIRIIFRGREVADTETFSGANIVNNDVVHAIISEAPTRPQEQSYHVAPSSPGLGGSELLIVCLSTICMLCWMLAFSLPELFSSSSLVMMTGLTSVLIAVCISKFS